MASPLNPSSNYLCPPYQHVHPNHLPSSTPPRPEHTPQYYMTYPRLQSMRPFLSHRETSRTSLPHWDALDLSPASLCYWNGLESAQATLPHWNEFQPTRNVYRYGVVYMLKLPLSVTEQDIINCFSGRVNVIERSILMLPYCNLQDVFVFFASEEEALLAVGNQCYFTIEGIEIEVNVSVYEHEIDREVNLGENYDDAADNYPTIPNY